MPVITITSDWKNSDYYLPVLKGRIMSLFQGVSVVDITNSAKSFDVYQACFILKNSYRSFPKGSIHLITVGSGNLLDKELELNDTNISLDQGVIDAIGSGNGVWIFSYDSFKQYIGGVEKLFAYIEDPANKIDAEALIFYGGHDWQKGDLEKLDMQYLHDMRTLIEQIGKGTAEYDPQAYNPTLNANFKYGTAKITWNTEFAKRFAEEMAAE